MFDVTNAESFIVEGSKSQGIEYWYNDISLPNAPHEVIRILVGNKANLKNQRKVTKEDAEYWANLHKMKYIEVNSLDVASVNQLIHQAVEIVCDKLDKGGYGKVETLVMQSYGIITRDKSQMITLQGTATNT